MKRVHIQRRTTQAGFTLIEALIALVVMAVGMLALGGMQIAMNRNSDVAKQRSEAVRLAQLKLEELRSYDGLATGTFTYAADVVSSPADETICPTCAAPLDSTTNTTFTRSWTVTRNDGVTPAVATDPQKWIDVRVAWTDRSGQAQEVRLKSVIARNDPFSLGGLLAGQARSKVRYPKNRNVNIPYPAISLPGGLSSFKPLASAPNYVFDNTTGHVVGYCNDAAIANSISTDTALSFSGTVTSGCTAAAGYLLSGFVSFKTTGAAATAANLDDDDLTDATQPLHATTPVTIDATTTGNGPASHTCYSQRQKVVQASSGSSSPQPITGATRASNEVTVTTPAAHGYSVGHRVAITAAGAFGFNGSFEILSVPTSLTFTYAQVGPAAASTGGEVQLIQRITVEESVSTPGYTTVKSRFIAYTCVVAPGADEAGTAWWGEARLVTDGSWTLGTTSAERRICRFSGDYIADNAVSNHEHPRYYRRVVGTLDNQNYLVIPGGGTCPPDVNSDPVAGDFVNTNTVTHQPAAAIPELSFKCTNAACGGSNKVQIENALTGTADSDAIPMFCPLTTAGCT